MKKIGMTGFCVAVDEEWVLQPYIKKSTIINIQLIRIVISWEPAELQVWKNSGWQDLNLRPLRPERSALPSCATSRNIQIHHNYIPKTKLWTNFIPKFIQRLNFRPWLNILHNLTNHSFIYICQLIWKFFTFIPSSFMWKFMESRF